MTDGDLDQLGEVHDTESRFLTDEELKKRTTGRVVVKDDFVHLSEIDYTLKQIKVGAGWDIASVDPSAWDVDLSAFLLDKNDQTRDDIDFVFYNNLNAYEGAVIHLGDNRTGIGDGDDEVMIVDLAKLPFEIMKIVFVVSIHDAEMRDQNVTGLRKIFIRLLNADSHQELVKFPVVDEFTQKDSYAIIVGELLREGPVWAFRARLEGVTKGGLAKVATDYGMMVTG